MSTISDRSTLRKLIYLDISIPEDNCKCKERYHQQKSVDSMSPFVPFVELYTSLNDWQKTKSYTISLDQSPIPEKLIDSLYFDIILALSVRIYYYVNTNLIYNCHNLNTVSVPIAVSAEMQKFTFALTLKEQYPLM